MTASSSATVSICAVLDSRELQEGMTTLAIKAVMSVPAVGTVEKSAVIELLKNLPGSSKLGLSCWEM